MCSACSDDKSQTRSARTAQHAGLLLPQVKYGRLQLLQQYCTKVGFFGCVMMTATSLIVLHLINLAFLTVRVAT